MKNVNYKNMLRNKITLVDSTTVHYTPSHYLLSPPIPSFLRCMSVDVYIWAFLMAFRVTLIRRNIAESWSQNLCNFVVDNIVISMWTITLHYLSHFWFNSIWFYILQQILFYISTFFIFNAKYMSIYIIATCFLSMFISWS